MYDVPVANQTVRTMDSEIVGRVTHVQLDRFRVASQVRAFWLASGAVFTACNDTVTLVCTRAGLASYVVPGQSRRRRAVERPPACGNVDERIATEAAGVTAGAARTGKRR